MTSGTFGSVDSRRAVARRLVYLGESPAAPADRRSVGHIGASRGPRPVVGVAHDDVPGGGGVPVAGLDHEVGPAGVHGAFESHVVGRLQAVAPGTVRHGALDADRHAGVGVVLAQYPDIKLFTARSRKLTTNSLQ